MGSSETTRKFQFPRILNGNPEAGFHLRVRKSSGCWEWIGSLASNGYGLYPTYKKYLGTPWAHRIAYILFHGPIPHGMVVMHSCDNKLCVNPQHLSIGTQLDNESDKINKGRQLSGDRHPQAKLTVEQVRVIRVENGTYKELAAKYGVAPSQICVIKRGRAWKNV